MVGTFALLVAFAVAVVVVLADRLAEFSPFAALVNAL